MKDKLLDSIDRNLTWVHQHLPYFALPKHEEDEYPSLDMSRKRIGELSLLLFILSQLKGHLDDYRIRDIISHVKEIANSVDFHFNMHKNLELFPFYLGITNGLKSAGITYPQYDFYLQQTVDSCLMDLIERSNWNKIDFVYNLNFAGLKHHMPDKSVLYKDSSLFHLPSIAHVRNIDAYAITHIIFHMSNFGAEDMDAQLKHKTAETKEYVALLTGLYDHYKDYDLLGEMLICCHNLKHRDFPLFQLHWDNLLASQKPGGDFVGRHIQAMPEPPVEAAEIFQHNYHPTLVGLIACVLEYNFLTANE